MEVGFLEALQAGGDTATIILAIAIWRMDRRLLKLEFLSGGKG